ncbi:hypothetical protein BC828DRAFT_278725 [Blastocladiella britannica]|nr:hypothetical protein BC828DRAFT_278725 [Blastocladiella britannica]
MSSSLFGPSSFTGQPQSAGQQQPQHLQGGAGSQPVGQPMYFMPVTYGYPTGQQQQHQQQQQQQQQQHDAATMAAAGFPYAPSALPPSQQQQQQHGTAGAPQPIHQQGFHVTAPPPTAHLSQQQQQQQQYQYHQQQQQHQLQGAMHFAAMGQQQHQQPQLYYSFPGTSSSVPRSLGTPAPGPGPGSMDVIDEDAMSMYPSAPAPRVQEGFVVAASPSQHVRQMSFSGPAGTLTTADLGASPIALASSPMSAGSAAASLLGRGIPKQGGGGSGGSGTGGLLRQAQVAAAGAASPIPHSLTLGSAPGAASPLTGFEWPTSTGGGSGVTVPSTMSGSFDPTSLSSSFPNQPNGAGSGLGVSGSAAAAAAAAALFATSLPTGGAVPVPIGTPHGTPSMLQIGSQASSFHTGFLGSGAGGGGGGGGSVAESPILSTFAEADELDPSGKNMQVIYEKRRRRRESHNAVERRRRDNINERISELGLLLPEYYVGSDPAVKPNKGQILRKVVDYVRHVQQTLKDAVDRQLELENALRNLSVEPPESRLLQTMHALLALPQTSLHALNAMDAANRGSGGTTGGGGGAGSSASALGLSGHQSQQSLSPGLPTEHPGAFGALSGGSGGSGAGGAGGMDETVASSVASPGTPIHAMSGMSLQSPATGAPPPNILTGGFPADALHLSMSPTVTGGGGPVDRSGTGTPTSLAMAASAAAAAQQQQQQMQLLHHHQQQQQQQQMYQQQMYAAGAGAFSASGTSAGGGAFTPPSSSSGPTGIYTHPTSYGMVQMLPPQPGRP